MFASRVVLPVVGLAGFVALPASASAAIGVTAAPKCVKPGATTTVTANYSPVGETQQNRKQAQTIIEPNTYAATGNGGGLKSKFGVRFPLGPVTYSPSASLPGTFDGSFTQQITLPAAKTYDKFPVLSYYTRVEAFDASGTRSFGFDGRTTDIEVDVPRVIPTGTRARRGESISVLAVGYGAQRKAYIHVVRGNKRVRRVEVPSSPAGGCGRRLVFVKLPKSTKPGTYRFVMNVSKTSRSAKGFASANVRVTR